MKARRPELEQSEIIEELPAACASEAAAVEFFEAKRWGGCPACVHCGSVGVYAMTDSKTGGRNKRYLWRCRDCAKQFTVRVGTIFEDSGIPLHKWCRAYWEAATAKNGVSALEISRKLQISYKSALFLMHRMRFAMTDIPTDPPKMDGTVEADETFVGGKPRHKGWRHGKKDQPRDAYTSKAPVLAVLQRGGSVRTKVVANVTAESVSAFVRDNVSPDARLMTDESRKYSKIGQPFKGGHFRTNHSKGEYVNAKNREIHSNSVEGFFSKVKRGLNGVFHAVSKEHLHRYMNHFGYLYNTRGMNDGERVLDLIRKSDGKRLTYNESKASA